MVSSLGYSKRLPLQTAPSRAGDELKKKLLGGVGVVVLAPVQCLWYRIREKIKIRTESVGDGGA